MKEINKVIDALASADEFVNPAIALAVRLQQAEVAGDTAAAAAAAIKSGELERAIEAGKAEGRAVHRALFMLGRTFPVASKEVPVGF